MDELWVHVRHAECNLVAIGDPVNMGLEQQEDTAGSKSNNRKDAPVMSEARRLLRLCGM